MRITLLPDTAYGVASYTKGEVLLEQLKYIIGESAFEKGMLAYYNTWKFKHPNPIDFFRVMENTSGLELDWFKEYFVNTTHTIDYELESYKGKTITLKEDRQINDAIRYLYKKERWKRSAFLYTFGPNARRKTE